MLAVTLNVEEMEVEIGRWMRKRSFGCPQKFLDGVCVRRSEKQRLL